MESPSSPHPRRVLRMSAPNKLAQQLADFPPDLDLGRSLQAPGSPANTAPSHISEFLTRLLRQPIHVAPLDPRNSDWAQGWSVAKSLKQSLNHIRTEGGAVFQLFRRTSKRQVAYYETRSPKDLLEAIQASRELLSATSDDNPDRARRLERLAHFLCLNNTAQLSLGEIEESIRAAKQCVDITPDDDEEMLHRRQRLQKCLYLRYARMDTRANLIALIQYSHPAIATMPDGSLSQLICMLRLGQALTSAFLGGHNISAEPLDDVMQSFLTIQAALAKMPQEELRSFRGNWLYARGMFYLGYDECLLTPLSEVRDDLPTLDDGINDMLSGIYRMSDVEHDLAMCINRLGSSFALRYEKNGQECDLKAALFCYSFVLNASNTAPLYRITAGAHFIRTCEDLEDAYEVSCSLLSLAPLISSISTDSGDMQQVVEHMSCFAIRAAAVAIKAGKGPYSALSLLEQGRGVLWTSAMQRRTDIIRLQKDHAVTAGKLEAVRNELSVPGRLAVGYGGLQEIPAVAQILGLGGPKEDQLEHLLDEIRTFPGFEGFLSPPSLAETHDAAKSGPIVVIYLDDKLGSQGCAILIEQHRIRDMPLPELTADAARTQMLRPGSKECLEWLWDVIANPILDALGFSKTPDDDNWPHVWWIPAGVIGRFPIHAAGHHYRRSGEAVLDRVMSSYTSSITALIHGRRGAKLVSLSKPSRIPRALLVAMESTPHEQTLPFARQEIDTMHQQMASMQVESLEPPRQKRFIIDTLATCDIFHFAGHATANDDLLQSSLLLEDWQKDRLTMANLLEKDLRNPFLAYLSACGTGNVKQKELLDESMHLASVFQMAGFRHVIGTLWEVHDEVCIKVAMMLYEGLKDGGMTDESVCRGLHNAVRTLRDEWLSGSGKDAERDELARWVDALSAEGKDTRSAGGEERPAGKGVVLDEDAGDEAPWVAYVHFGV